MQAVFGAASKKALPIPRVIDNYNNNMGGVDIADQLCGYYGIQLPIRRTWVPLFYWLLDTLIVKSYLIFKKSGKNINYKDFQIQLVWDLINASIEESSQTKKPNTQSRVDLTINRLRYALRVVRYGKIINPHLWSTKTPSLNSINRI